MRNWRKLHGYVALVIALPLIITTITGIILLYRDQVEFIQPAAVTQRSISPEYVLSYAEIEKRFPDLDQVIYKPSKGSMVIRFKDGMESHIHPATGEVIKSSLRRTGLLVDIHQGSWLGKFGQYFINALMAAGLLFLIISGIVIFPFKRKKT